MRDHFVHVHDGRLCFADGRSGYWQHRPLTRRERVLWFLFMRTPAA